MLCAHVSGAFSKYTHSILKAGISRADSARSRLSLRAGSQNAMSAYYAVSPTPQTSDQVAVVSAVLYQWRVHVCIGMKVMDTETSPFPLHLFYECRLSRTW